MGSRRRAMIAGLAAAGLLVTGCGDVSPGAAAVVGDDRISERELTEQVEQVLIAQGRPVDSSSQALVVTTLDRMITTSLVEQLAEQEGIEVTQGELDATLANYAEASGGQEAFEEALVQQDLAPDDIPEIIRVNILAQKISFELDPQGSPESQSAAIFNAVTAFSEQVGTEVSPRYGTWDPVSLAVGGTPDDLSAPATS
ncbi:MAG TPA: SurA N-terminal domain-containing protein [Candidatus Nanopelagicales bacterium]|nr:SurA N-terminal domain-containing protein [Candidatus Nanopelagicales bacterium]